LSREFTNRAGLPSPAWATGARLRMGTGATILARPGTDRCGEEGGAGGRERHRVREGMNGHCVLGAAIPETRTTPRHSWRRESGWGDRTETPNLVTVHPGPSRSGAPHTYISIAPFTAWMHPKAPSSQWNAVTAGSMAANLCTARSRKDQSDNDPENLFLSRC